MELGVNNGNSNINEEWVKSEQGSLKTNQEHQPVSL